MNTQEIINSGVNNSNNNKNLFVCPIETCKKSFKFESHFKRHALTHSQQRPFQCQFCDKGFRRLDALQIHERVHTKCNPYKCTFTGCTETFASKSALRYHFLKHNNQQIYSCDYPGCQRTFLTLGQLKQHQNTKIHQKEEVTKKQQAIQGQSSPSSDFQVENPAVQQTIDGLIDRPDLQQEGNDFLFLDLPEDDHQFIKNLLNNFSCNYSSDKLSNCWDDNSSKISCNFQIHNPFEEPCTHFGKLKKELIITVGLYEQIKKIDNKEDYCHSKEEAQSPLLILNDGSNNESMISENNLNTQGHQNPNPNPNNAQLVYNKKKLQAVLHLIKEYKDNFEKGERQINFGEQQFSDSKTEQNSNFMDLQSKQLHSAQENCLESVEQTSINQMNYEQCDIFNIQANSNYGFYIGGSNSRNEYSNNFIY